MRADLYTGDCLDVLPSLPPNSVDTIITDPPYGLRFMGKGWDHGVPGIQFWEEALRVAKPGAMLLAFGGTRTFHRLICAIEDAGWILRDCIMWTYGSGFPKGQAIGKAIDKAAGAEREVVGIGQYDGRRKPYTGGNSLHISKLDTRDGDFVTAPATPAAVLWEEWGTSIKPSWEPITVAMKPLDGTFANNALKHGVAGFWIDGCRIGSAADMNPRDFDDRRSPAPKFSGKYNSGKEGMYREREGQVPNGRYPANLIHDGSDEVLGAFPVTAKTGDHYAGRTRGEANTYGKLSVDMFTNRGDVGGTAARYFYCAKASARERDAGLAGDKNKHVTVKPLALMRYLCRLTKTPTGGTILDPFMGSGSTGCAAVAEERDFIGIDLSDPDVQVAAQRIKHWGGAMFTEIRLHSVVDKEPHG